jgi:D-beta-D-heptose 7-phosphate kinase/D-beta-D-heptose 1-phosphate adenosyltransferase
MRIGLANGCMDRFHRGHMHYLIETQEHCDYLIVAVNSDASVKRLKGPTRPIDSLAKRMAHVAQFCGEWPHAVIPFEGRVDKLLMEIRPDVYFAGYDHSAAPMFIRRPGWKEHGEWDRVEVIQVSHLPGYSTTRSLHATE